MITRPFAMSSTFGRFFETTCVYGRNSTNNGKANTLSTNNPADQQYINHKPLKNHCKTPHQSIGQKF
jgi:hypothetical protein